MALMVRAIDNVGNPSAWVESETATVQTTVTKYYYLAWQPSGEGRRVAMRQGSSVYYLYGDHLGSTSLIANASGAVVAETRYLPYGQAYWQWGASQTDFGFTGQRMDGFGLMDYNARYYDPLLGHFVSPDSIVPSVGEGNNPNAIGYVIDANYSALVVDYHENQFLVQLNQENRIRLEDPNEKLPGVPTNSLAFDRYAYTFNNPIRFNDPSGHCPGCVVGLTILAGTGITVSAPVVLLTLVVVGLALHAVLPGREQRNEDIKNFVTQTTNGINVLLHKDDWIPPNLTKEQQKLWGRAAELYKKGLELPGGYPLPKDVAEDLAELLRQGLSPDQAADKLDELEDYSDEE